MFPKKLFYHFIAYSHLQYAIICWGNANKSIMKRLQVKQNRVVKTLRNTFGRKTRLKLLYNEVQILKINGICILEIGEFMTKVRFNTLSEDFLKNFITALTSVHKYSTRSALSNKFYVERTSKVKTNRSLKVFDVNVWNSSPDCIRDKAVTSSCKTYSKILKKHFLLQS